MFEERGWKSAGRVYHGAMGPNHGPPLVTVHGLARCWQDWLPILPTLTARWQVLGVDLRGHGETEWFDETDYFALNYAEDALAALAQLREPAVLMGHSLGALAVLAAASRAANRVRGLVLIDPPLEPLGEAFLGILRQNQAILRDRPHFGDCVRAVEAIQIPNPNSGVPDRAGDLFPATMLRWHAHCLLRTDPAVFDPILAGRWLVDFDTHRIAERIDCPVLLFQCDPAAGGLLGDSGIAPLQRLLPDLVHIRLKGVGHEPLASHPEVLRIHLVSFLETLRNPR